MSIGNFEKYQALKASAGSGKTFALSVRYLALLFMGAKTSEILALTFTKKATNEMKERIIKYFLNLHCDENSDFLGMLADTLGKNRDEIIALRDKKRDEFLKSDIKISTIDAFFGQIMRAFALNFGIRPDYASVADTSDRYKKMENLFIKNSKIDIDEVIDYIVNSNEFKSSSNYNTQTFFNSLNDFSLKLKSSPLPAGIPNKVDIDKKIDALIRALNPENKAENALREKLLSTNEISNLTTFIEHFNEDGILSYRKSKSENPIAIALFAEFLEEYKKYYDKIEQYKIYELSRFLQAYQAIKDEYCRKNNEYSFDEITQKVHSLLQKVDTNFIYFRLDGRINHILIDEFQDTNVAQYEVLKPLVDEIMAGSGQSEFNTFFYVGDTKQSIYRFRGAVKEFFDTLPKNYMENGKSRINIQNLGTNYRSQKLIVKFVNSLFKDSEPQLAANSLKNILNLDAAKGYLSLHEGEKFPVGDEKIENDDFGYIKIFSNSDVMEAAADEAKRLIDSGINQKDIAILVWTNKNIDEAKEHLKERGIESVGEGQKTLFEYEKTRAVIEYAKFCLSGDKFFQANTAALIEGKFSDINLNYLNERYPKISLKFAQTAADNIKFLIKKLGFGFDDQNLLLLIEFANNFSNIAEMVFSSNWPKIITSRSSGVTLMTIHGSKGLEFEHLILCDKTTTRSPNNGDEFLSEYNLNKNLWELKYKSKNRNLIDNDFKAFISMHEARNNDELKNDLYVGFTRAKKSLIVIKKPEKSLFDEFFGLPEFEFGTILRTKDEIEDKFEQESKEINLAHIPAQNVAEMVADSGNLHAINFGLAMHYSLEMCKDFKNSEIKLAIQKAKNRYGKFLQDSDFNDISNRLDRLFKNEIFLKIIDNCEIYREQTFKRNGEFKVIDLLTIDKNRKIATIVDYKSGRDFEGKNAAQVRFYKESVEAFFPEFKVNAFVFHILKDKIEIDEI